ncbi:hypothetical protein [Parasedimentitalea psychrophila]|uniref:Uncharacterized protein n=1 Tax=Parasedimentitalea psychrophila TaxID=2997337 RepID=A0A9Y2KXX5_9RHOB|nr:hypothetical protein [Parasedimentitalea psychrophila]WIY25175.1 hypothetical protein QPJ95_22240 [Parasedimentitalea psychrophila]
MKGALIKQEQEIIKLLNEQVQNLQSGSDFGTLQATQMSNLRGAWLTVNQSQLDLAAARLKRLQPS